MSLLALVLPSSAGAATTYPLTLFDSVHVAGSTGNGFFQNIAMDARAAPDGTEVGGSAVFDLGAPGFHVGGPVTCLRVSGPDLGSGNPLFPTRATLNVATSNFGIVTVELVDDGGNGRDVMSAIPIARRPADCTPLISPIYPTGTLTAGRAVVFDAPLLPTSKEQCKAGGLKRFGFRNQGQCIRFVERR